MALTVCGYIAEKLCCLLPEQIREENHHATQDQQNNATDNLAVFCIALPEIGVERQNSKAENDQIVQHEKEVIE